MGCDESSEKAKELLKEFETNERNLAQMSERWPSGCVYTNRIDTENRIGPNGLTQIRKRTCRSVTGCDDPDYNHAEICGPWSEWS